MNDDVPGHGIRLAFAGVAHWHFSVDAGYLELARASGVEIVGLCDDDEALARRRADEIGCDWASDPSDLVSKFRPDIVVALPRPDRAPEQLGQLLDQGVPIFAEKPLGLRADDVWPLVERAEQGWVTVAFPQRYLPLWAHLERLRQQGRLGTVGHVGLRQINGPPGRYRDFGVPWMLDPAIAGGGPLRNIGIHLTDALVRILGNDAIRVVGATSTTRMHGEPIEDFIAALFETADGISATLETGYSFSRRRPGDMDLRVAGTGAYLIQRRDELQIFPAEGEPEVISMPPGFNAYQEIFFDALRRLRNGSPPVATVRDCALANDVIDKIYAAVGSSLVRD
jgi:predicted dehydrogenase